MSNLLPNSSAEQVQRISADEEQPGDEQRPNIHSESAYGVLIVDDDIDQAEMAREFLRISGFEQIDHVENIRSLWKLLAEHTYDIILLDYKLPDGTGLDALRQMAELEYHIPVVMVTGQGDERVAAQAIQRGAADYIIKSGDYLLTLPALIRKTIHAHQLQLSVQRSLEQIHYQAMLLNNVRDAIVVWDMAGLITYWNPAATVLFGWSVEERLARPVAQVYLSAFSPAITQPKEGDNFGQHVVRRCTNRDGKIIWVSSRVTALQSASGQRQTDADKSGQTTSEPPNIRTSGTEGRLIGFMDVSHDITRRVEAENALRESEARYRAIVEDYQTELICRFSSNGTLTFVNEVFCHYFGKSREELVGMNFLFFIPEVERHKIIQHLGSFGPHKTVATLEHQVELPEQGLRWLQRTDRAILDSKGRIFEFQSVGRDITDRKRLEAQILAAQTHLVQAARLATIGEMAAGFAHQIYNPLTTIIADAQILLRSLPEQQPGRDSAEAIEQAGWRMQQVVQRLMEFSRPAEDALTSLSINASVQSALSLVSTHIEAIGCRLEIELSDGLPPVRGNSYQLENLWVNLLLLARDASANGAHECGVIGVHSLSGPLDSVIVEISDNGEPIPAEQLPTIFEPNFIGPTSGRGTGMELSVCREIVRQHGGQITADSAPEQRDSSRFTIFRVALPADESEHITSSGQNQTDEVRPIENVQTPEHPAEV